MNKTPIFKDLVLVGGGHCHALVLRKWAMEPMPGVRVTLISPQAMTPYSGMLPGLIAGHYRFEQTHIDLVKLSLWANIRFIQDAVTGIDVDNKTLSLKQRPDIGFDIVSIDIGSTPNQQIAGSATYSTAVKPISDFYARWNLIQEKAQQQQIKSLGVVGGGAGSVEVLLAIAYKLKAMQRPLEYHLITAADDILPGYNRLLIQQVKKQLNNYQIKIHTSTEVTQLKQGLIVSQQSDPIACDEIIWCTQASGSSWLRDSGLECDEGGFIKVRQSLQALHYDYVFGAGDIINMVANPRPKAGVYAVRQAPVLLHNLQAILLKQSLRNYQPQDGFLSLLALGEQTGTGSKSIISFSGDWVWRWKDSIDRKFMDQFHQLPPLSMQGTAPLNPRLIDEDERLEQHDPLKRCSGCGAKIAAPVLQTVINDLLGAGHYQPQDAIKITETAELVYQSVDALKTPIQDPWLFGQIAVNHALSDLYAMNLKPVSAQVLITLPYASQEIQKRQLKMLMQGIFRQLDTLQCRFLGGHTSEASELSVGLVVNGIQQETGLFHKHGLMPGDKLVLSKALGIGLILAAAMQDQCDGELFNQAMDCMLQANERAARLLATLDVQACTDVTGFGLLGHLHELCLASACAASINLNAIPVLSGIEALGMNKIKSSLYAQNQRALADLNWSQATAQHARFNLLFDPQTSGGLLAGIPAQRYAELDETFHQQFYTIGTVNLFDPAQPRIKIEAG